MAERSWRPERVSRTLTVYWTLMPAKMASSNATNARSDHREPERRLGKVIGRVLAPGRSESVAGADEDRQGELRASRRTGQTLPNRDARTGPCRPRNGILRRNPDNQGGSTV